MADLLRLLLQGEIDQAEYVRRFKAKPRTRARARADAQAALEEAGIQPDPKGSWTPKTKVVTGRCVNEHELASVARDVRLSVEELLSL